MQLRTRMLALTGAALLNFGWGTAQADGLADLKASLARLRGEATVKGTLEVTSFHRQGEGKEADDRQGQCRVAVEEGARGLQVFYGRDLLAQAEAEGQANAKDKKAKTPTLHALREIDSADVRMMTAAANSLAREIEQAVFKSEADDSYKGQPARRLTFEMPLDKLSERDRKYVKKFDTVLDVWIAADGTPLASSLHMKAAGRAMVVISFESRTDEERRYAVVGDRLVMVRRDVKGHSAGAGEKQEFHITRTLQLQS